MEGSALLRAVEPRTEGLADGTSVVGAKTTEERKDRLTTDGQAVTDEVLDAHVLPRLGVAYDATSSSPLELVERVGRQCQIVWIVESGDPRLGSWARLLPRLGQVVDVAGRSASMVAESLRGELLDGVIAFTDSQLHLAATVGQVLGLPGNPPEVVDALLDKVTQRIRLAEGGVTVPQFVRIASGKTVDEAIELAKSVGFPLVVKPARGTASRDVFQIADLGLLKSCFGTIIGGAPHLTEDYLAEAWLNDAESREWSFLGRYVSVEAVARDGVITPLAITGKFPTAPPSRETGNFMPHHLAPEEAARVRTLSIEAAEALGVRSGALHIEIKLTENGPRVIEVNGRVGGGGIDQLYEATQGQSLTRLATQIALGQPFDLPVEGVLGDEPVEYDYFVQPPMGASRLAAVGHLDAVPALEGVLSAQVNRTVGDDIDWREGSQGYVLSVRGSVPHHSDLADVAPRIMEALELAFD